MENINKIICVDALKYINSLANNSINLIITVPHILIAEYMETKLSAEKIIFLSI